MPIPTTVVELAYRLILGREPVNIAVVEEHAKSCHSLAELRAALISSPEFRARGVDASLDRGLPGDPSGIRLHIDEPILVEGAANATRSGGLRIGGWALHPDGISAIEIHVDGEVAGLAYHGTPRPDVAAAFPGIEGAGGSGYVFAIPEGRLGKGEHAIRMRVRARSGATLERDFRLHCDGEPEGWVRRRLPLAERAMLEELLKQAGATARIDVIVLDHASVDEPARRKTLAGIAAQTHACRRVRIIAPDEETARKATSVAAECLPGARVEVGVAGSAPLVPASEGQALVMFLHMGDEPGCDAAAMFALHGALNPDAALFYADEVRGDPANGHVGPFFKPDHSPTLLLAMNYFGRP